MLSSPSTEVRESLQCLACAAQQEMTVFNADILRKLMLEAQTKSSMVDGESVGKTWDKCVVSFRALSQFVTWADVTDQTKASEKLLNRWLDSSVYIAKALSNNNKFKKNDYTFFRRDEFNPGSYKDFGEVFTLILDRIGNNAKLANIKKFFESEVLTSITLGKGRMEPNKWNPADMIAIESGKITKWENDIGGFLNSNRQSTITGDLAAYTEKMKQQNLPKQARVKVEVMSSIGDLYEYNKLINTGITSGEFIPVSLKLTDQKNPYVDYIKVSEPADLEKYFHIKVKQGKFEYDVTTQGAVCPFTIVGLPGADGGYTFTIRGFSSTEVFGDVNVELKRDGAGAQAGKISPSVITKIAKLSGAKRAYTTLSKKRHEIWKKYIPPGQQQPTKGVFWKHTVSKIHGLTDYRVFRTLHLEHTKMMRKVREAQKKRVLNREQLGFQRRVDPQTGELMGLKKHKALMEDPQGVVNDVKMWAEYANWLSAGETTMNDFMDEAVGKRQWRDVLKRERSKKAKNSNFDHYDITLSLTQAKYMQRKIQAYEQAWIIDNTKTDNPISKEVKENVLKSMYMYAASKGFHIFNKKTVRSYLLGSSHLKCAA